jgi:hypothetical protein
MAAQASIAQEFFKVRNEWEKVDRLHSWKLAIWVIEYADLDIVDKFMETERTAVGVFDDIFFRVDSTCKNDIETFEKAIWQEFLEWFTKPSNEKQDMYQALKNDGLLLHDFTPNTNLAPTAINFFNELIRFKNSIEGLNERNFCLYFPPTMATDIGINNWFNTILQNEIPNGIRLATIDYAKTRKIKIGAKIPDYLVAELYPQLNMMDAINNEMDKAGSTYNTTGVDALFRKQIRVVMNSTVLNNGATTEKEVNILLSLGKQMKSESAHISSLLIAAQAYFSIAQAAKSEQYVDEALVLCEKGMQKKDPTGYPTWKACAMLKGAILVGNNKKNEALVIYKSMIDNATANGDTFFVMEGYRLCGHLNYEMNNLPAAFELLLLALVAGSYLEKVILQQSTFLQAAYLALHIGRKIKSKQELNILENQLETWLGKNWEQLLQEEGVSNAKTTSKKSLLPIS